MAKIVKNKKQAIVTQKDFNMVLRILKNNWWVPFIFLPISYGLGKLYVYRLTYVYKASTEFLLKPNDTYYQNNVLNDASFYSFGSYVDNLNETRVLKSYNLASKVVEKLEDRLKVSYFIIGKVRRTEQFTGMPFVVLVNSINPSFYEKVIDFRIIDYNNYEISYEENGVKISKTGKFNQDLVDMSLNMSIRINRLERFSESTTKALSTIFYQFSVHNNEYLISNIRSNLSIENPEYTNILKIELKDIIPERAVLILDTLNSVYSQSKLKTRLDLNDRTITYIDIQLDQITHSLKSIEDTMQEYKQKKSIINLEWEQQDFLNKIGGYDGQRSKLQLEIRELNNLEAYIIEDRDPRFLPPNAFVSEKDGYMTKAVQDLYAKQIELNQLYNVAKENNPVVSSLKSSILKTKQDLLIYISNTRKAEQKQIENLDKEILNYINEAKLIPIKQRDILNIQRKANVSEQLYNFLLEKKASTKIARASIVPDVKIVESPRYAGVDSPNASNIQSQFISVGLLLTLVVVLIRTLFFMRITSVEYLKDLTSLPLIGVLPLVKSSESEGIVVDQSPNSSLAEAFRSFRTNLQYANVDVQAKTYLVTSFLPGEGKTFTSVNLATIFAKSGKRTVVIELDLHKPRVYKRFDLESQKVGVTTYIAGQSTYKEILTETRIQNLYAIYSGPIPPNPSELVLSEKMKELINIVKSEFDYVIIDTPPAGLLSDSLYLLQYVDASIFVLNTRTSNKRVITFIESIIEENNLNNVMLLLNGVSKTGRRYYYQGYGYGYGYGYSYSKGHSYRR